MRNHITVDPITGRRYTRSGQRVIASIEHVNTSDLRPGDLLALGFVRVIEVTDTTLLLLVTQPQTHPTPFLVPCHHDGDQREIRLSRSA